jgi:VanZ family protein
VSPARSPRPSDSAPDSPDAPGGAGWRRGSALALWGPVVVYLAVIFVGSSFPKLPDLPGGLSDKVAHAAEYAVLGLLLTRALAGPRWLPTPVPYAVSAVALAGLYGLSDECHQLLVPGRDFDLMDLAADVAGATAAAVALSGWGIIRRFWGASTRLRSRGRG